MLKQVAEGVLIHEIEFTQSNSVVGQARAGVLLFEGERPSRIGPARGGRFFDAS